MKKLIFGLILFFTCLPCCADILTVDDDGPADFNNIQAAIDYSSDGDIIIVQPGHYDGVKLQFFPWNIIHFFGKNITLTSINPSNFDTVSSTIINSSIVFKGTESPDCVLSGFKIYGNYIGGIIGNNLELDEFPFHSKATVTNCIIQKNNFLECIRGCDGLIKNCILTDNMNTSDALLTPSISNCYGTLKNCTIANNYGDAAIQVGPNPGHLKLENCIIYGNLWSQIWIMEGCSISISYCNIQDGLGSFVETGNILWGPGNIDSDPCFVRNGFWNTFEGDYHLKSQGGRWDPNTQSWVIDDVTSPCIDAGNPGCPLGSEPNDSNNIRINMGAFGGTPLASKTPANWRSISDLTNDWIVDSHDLFVFTDYWLGTDRCLPSDLNRNQSVDFADFAIFSLNWLAGK